MFYKPINVLYMKKLILTLLGILFLGAFSAFAESVTIEQSAFTTTNGDVAGDANIAYTTAKGGGTSNPFITKGTIRLYQPSGNNGGGTITIQAKNDCTITSMSIGSAQSTTVKYKVGDEAEVTNQSIAANAKLQVNNISTNTITFTCMGANSSSRLEVNYLSVTYTTGGSSEPTITLAFAETEGSVNAGETLALPAVNATTSEGTLPELTYTYTSDKPEVATVENGVVTGVAAGTAKITATCAVDGYNVKDAEFTVTVVDPNATDETIIFANMGYSNQEVISTVTQGVVTLNFDKGSNSIDPKYFTNNKAVRLYAGGSLTISVEDGYYITKIESVYNNTQNTLSSDTGEFNSNYTTWTKTTNVNSVKFTESGTSGNRSWTQIKVYYEKAGDPSKTTPKLSFAETEVVEEFVEGKTLAVQVPTSDTDGLSYTYKSSDPAVATVEGETITLVGTGSTTITVTSAESETLNSATASYTLVSEMVYHSIADLLKYAKDGETVDIAFPMTVGHVGPQGKNFYVTDGEGYMLIYNSKGITMPAYENLDVIPAGWTATCTIYNGLPELVPVTAPAAATEKGTYAIETIDATNWAAQPLNKIVKVNNVVFDAATPGENASTAERNFTGKVGDTVIKFFNNFKLAAEDAGTYNVTAITSFFVNSQTTVGTETNQLAPIAYSAQPTEAVITPTPENDEIKVKSCDIITFTFANASKLEVVIETEEAPETQGAPVLKAAAEPITVEGDTYKYTVPAQVLNTIITVTPYNAEGEKLADRAASVMLVNADTTGVIDVTVAGEGEVEYFNLQGVRVANPESGLYIRRQGNQVSKIYLR